MTAKVRNHSVYGAKKGDIVNILKDQGVYFMCEHQTSILKINKKDLDLIPEKVEKKKK